MTASPTPNAEYKVGDSDTRPWGSYVVTGVGKNTAGEEFCAKDISVNPGGVLSLQSHDMRRELWTVKNGTLTVVLDDQRLSLDAGQSVNIPQGAIHCMANLTGKPVVVSEMQEGTCRESDIKRYVDANGRKTEPLNTATAQASVRIYNEVAAEAARMQPRAQVKKVLQGPA